MRRKANAEHLRLAIADGENNLRIMQAEHKHLSARGMQTSKEKARLLILKEYMEKQAYLNSVWRAKLSDLNEAKAEATKAIRTRRLSAAQSKRNRKRERNTQLKEKQA